MSDFQEHHLNVAMPHGPRTHRVIINLYVSDESFELLQEYKEAALHTGRILGIALHNAMDDPKFNASSGL